MHEPKTVDNRIGETDDPRDRELCLWRRGATEPVVFRLIRQHNPHNEADQEGHKPATANEREDGFSQGCAILKQSKLIENEISQ